MTCATRARVACACATTPAAQDTISGGESTPPPMVPSTRTSPGAPMPSTSAVIVSGRSSRTVVAVVASMARLLSLARRRRRLDLRRVRAAVDARDAAGGARAANDAAEVFEHVLGHQAHAHARVDLAVLHDE